MNKEEAEIKKIEIEIIEIEQRIKDKKYNNPILKFLFAGLIAGIVFFAAWSGIYKEIILKKTNVAIEDARLAHIKNQQLEIENEMKIKAIEEQSEKLKNEMQSFKAKNLSFIEQIEKQKENSDVSSLKYIEYEREIQKAKATNNELSNQLQELKFAGSMWYLVSGGFPNNITLLANGRIDGFGIFNDYWEVKDGELILYTGADSGKASWTRKWIGKEITANEVSGEIIDKNGNRIQVWKMTKKGGFSN